VFLYLIACCFFFEGNQVLVHFVIAGISENLLSLIHLIFKNLLKVLFEFPPGMPASQAPGEPDRNG